MWQPVGRRNRGGKRRGGSKGNQDQGRGEAKASFTPKEKEKKPLRLACLFCFPQREIKVDVPQSKGKKKGLKKEEKIMRQVGIDSANTP